jgi:replication-associated recombination protein RarA
MAYQIGYRRPPVSSQFKKGQSGNPQGRPRGTRNFVTLLKQELNQSIVVNENGKKKTITRLQAMVKRIVAGALQGDQKALLTLVEILRRTGQFEEPDVSALLPDDYEAILEAYVARRQNRSGTSQQKQGTARRDKQ